jgi:hypothetical protein
MEFTICPRVVLSNRSLDPFPRGNLSVEWFWFGADWSADSRCEIWEFRELSMATYSLDASLLCNLKFYLVLIHVTKYFF